MPPERFDGHETYLCAPVVAEMWFMALNSRRIASNVAELRALLASLPSLPLDDAAAEEYGHVRVELKRAGTPIGPFDMQIAAIARVHELTLLTDDSDFDNVDRLRRENWLR